MDIYFDKKDLIEFLDRPDKIGSGAYGKVRRYDLETLIKIYLKYIEGYDSKDIPNNFKKARNNELYIKKIFNESTRDEIIKERIKRLEYTKYSNDLILGSALYEDYAFGVVLNFYKNYKTLTPDNFHKLSKEKREYVLNQVDLIFEDLVSNYIYPIDVKQKNILFHPKTLDVKYVDLDDECTHYFNYYDEDEFKCAKSNLIEAKRRLLLNRKQL